MVTVVDIPTSEIFKYPDLDPTIDGVAKALERYTDQVSKVGNTKRSFDRVYHRKERHFIIVATEA